MVSFSNGYIGKCTATPQTSIILLEKVVVSCSDWEDEHLPLTFDFYFKKDGVAKTLVRSHVPFFNGSLPSGDKDNDYKLDVYVDIIDSKGGVTTFNMTNIVSCS